jgi:hypothetical protein
VVAHMRPSKRSARHRERESQTLCVL